MQTCPYFAPEEKIIFITLVRKHVCSPSSTISVFQGSLLYKRYHKTCKNMKKRSILKTHKCQIIREATKIEKMRSKGDILNKNMK
jgi:hypothetical protein